MVGDGYPSVTGEVASTILFIFFMFLFYIAKSATLSEGMETLYENILL